MPLVPDAAHRSFIFHHTQSFNVPKGQSQHQPLHRHAETVELLLVLEGKIECLIDHKPCTIPSGTVLLLHPGSWHEIWYAASEQQSGYCLSFVRNPSAAKVPETDLPTLIPISDTEALEAIFAQLKLEATQPQTDSGQMAHHLIGLMLALLGRSLKHSDGGPFSESDIIQKIKHFMEENHCRSLRLEDLADQFGINKYQLARLFKEQTGKSPLQYIISCRMDTAKQLLTTTKSPVAAIARITGYKSATQFQAAFKKAVGITPRHYRLKSYLKGEFT